MITQGTALFTRVRRWLSPTEWFVRWFHLPKEPSAGPERGLLMIQIDGLSRPQLERAIADGRMPFLKSLVAKEHYLLHDFYSGLPASTPSVQGELFYGTKCAVPAFGFQDHRSGEIVRMFAQDVASDVEARIARDEQGLLAGGSAYCNIYSGGAEDIHFCASSMGWSDLMQDINNWKLLPFLVWHLWSILRVGGLLVIEFLLACIGFVKGAVTKQEYWQELLMIPARVVVVILMRELASIGASMDVTRGVPIVQLNLMGYDEQAHRRGPSSAFAHWTLKGIDRTIRKLWVAAHRSAQKEYDVWIYSDHGQIATTAFEYITGTQIAFLAADVIEEVSPKGTEAHHNEHHPGQGNVAGVERKSKSSPHEMDADTRAHWLSAGWIVSKLFGEGKQDLQGSDGVQVAALGPLGLIYANREITHGQRLEIAERLVRGGVPLAFVATPETTYGITGDGRFDVMLQPEAIFGEDHPFLADVASDMDLLCRHADAGDVVVSGWVRGGESLSFAVQSGAHAGPSPEETNAFVMAPRDVSIENEREFLRPNDLRLAASRFMHPEQSRIATDNWQASTRPFRVMTYNVHGCVGMDHRLDVRRIARVIAQSQADIVALQELDVMRARSGFRDQAEEIARLLEMQCHYHPAWQLEEESYGDAILSRIPIRHIRKGQLPAKSSRHEPRGAVWVEAELSPGEKLQVINTHLSLYPFERRLQADALAQEWVRPAMEQGTTIVCGDFNAQPSSPSYRSLNVLLRDVQKHGARTKAAPTFFSPRPLARIDHIFVTDDIAVENAFVIHSRLARVASDHLPLVTDLCRSNRAGGASDTAATAATGGEDKSTSAIPTLE